MNEYQKTEMTLGEAVGSLTGFEVIAIEDHFNAPFEEMRPTRMVMGVIGVLVHRESGGKWVDNFSHAKSLTMKEIDGYFAEEPRDVDPNDPESDSGKEPSSDD